MKIGMFRFVVSLLFCVSSAAAAFAQNAAPSSSPAMPPGMKGADVNDPRAKLSAGLYDAGEAAMGLRHLLLLKKSEAFQLGTTDPNAPRVLSTLESLGIPDATKVPAASRMPTAQLAFGNTDLAFQGNHLFMGNFYGINIYDISDPLKTRLVTSLVCPGGQGDVSVYKNLMFMSVEMPNGRLDCGTQGFPARPPAEGQPQGAMSVEKDRFRGVRVFDISDIRNPKQVAAVQTCRGSHTHTLVTSPKDNNNIFVYVSGSSYVRPGAELAGCSGGAPDVNPDTANFRIEVIKVPLAAPEKSEIVSMPRIFADEERINALDSGGSHATAGRPMETDHCHDITAYPELGLAAGACSGNGILLDITDPVNPKRVASVNDPNYAYWHSASFSNDGSTVVYTDEWGGGMGARCRATDPDKWGANAIFRRSGNELDFASYYKLKAAQTETENCVAHNGSLVPVPGRDIKVQAWYQGGISVMDFTDPDNPFEIAYFDRGPIDAETLVMGGTWSAYWYNGKIYSSEIARGLDVLELTPTEHLTQAEIDAANTVRMPILNVQMQERIVWPRNLAVAKAYVDQLERSKAMTAAQVNRLRAAITKGEGSAGERRKLRGHTAMLEKGAASAKNARDAERMRALAAILKDPQT